ncbi:DUF7695 domain-containing protein [Cohnella phaseoli]|uniref:DUF7695 domain-containing protein n=1 Tax=Cohnella phaseoli TaxID=456490 RepID=UPI000E2549BB|nr:hypothetical protein [Cohnella phaseoli]
MEGRNFNGYGKGKSSKMSTANVKNEQNRKINLIAIRCKYCLVKVESVSIHDIKSCQCGRVGVDGGREYLIRSGSIDDYWELSEWET